MKLRVLLADDQTLFREGLRLLLEESARLEVVGLASNGSEAVAMSRELAPDVIVLDYRMPDLDGAEAARRIKTDNPCARILALSMHNDAEHARLMLEAGAAGFVPKDAPAEELREAIERVARGELFFGSSAAQEMLDTHLRRAGAGRAPGCEDLTPRQAEVLKLIAEGKSTKEAASLLGVSVKTIETYRAQIMSRLGLYSVAELTKYAIRAGLTEP